ncbi:hypothetical protein KPL70_025625 [Citrus sinensis]|nr:hypothetical protein KPL70_025625 [Citrus sinensis]
MSTNKERIERVEVEIGSLQDGMKHMELGLTDRLHCLEETMSKLVDSLSTSKGMPSHNNSDHAGSSQPSRGDSEGSRHQLASRLTKLECPRYSGDDPMEWYNRIMQFFEYQEATNEQKVSLASFHLEGGANQWWQWMRRTYQEEEKTVTWEIFVEELCARFGPTECKDYDEALSRVKQTRSLRDYQREFERLGNRVRGWTQKALVGTFMGGLNPKISKEIRMFWSKTLKEAINLARMKDDQLTRQRKLLRPQYLNSTPPAPTNNTHAQPTRPIKRPTWDEMQRRRAMGLCLNCNDRFTTGHKCTQPRLLLLESDTMNDETTYEGIPEVLCTEPDTREPTDPKIIFYALTGWAAPRIMRVTAKVGPYEIMVLIDSGSTPNFISSRMANMSRLPIIPTAGFSVRVANGETLSCKGKFEQVQVLLQEVPFTLTLYSLPITGLDMVLGVQWLEMLDSVVCNWKQLTMDFTWENKSCRLQGIGPQSIQTASLTKITKELRQGQSGFAICFHVNVEDSLNTTTPNMQDLLKEYNTLFQEPTKLPPRREIDHNITLIEGTEPVNVRPYRYAYFQKAEIEKQVQEMLNSGLIWPSTSAFSSPVRVNPADIHKTAFRTHNGHYEYLVMPIGLCNAPSTFQAIMNSIFYPYLRKFVLVFFNDILIYSPSWRSHLTHVKQAMKVLKEHQFFLKTSKCTFGQQELEYLGHIITSHGVKVDETKITAMVSWPQPKNISELRGFIGLTDASGDGIGAILQQQGQSIAFMSHALGVTNKSWSIYAKEMFAIIEAIRVWRPYLLGRKFIIQTDQRSLKPGRENVAADALSQQPHNSTLNSLFVAQALTQPTGPYFIGNGLIFFKGRVVVPLLLRQSLLFEAHDTRMGGHSGVLRTYKCLKQQFYWPSMFQTVHDYVGKCEICQKTKASTLKPVGLLQPLPIPCQLWDDITLDFVEGLPNSHSKNSILVVVDRLSKSAHFMALTHPFTAKMVAEKFIDGVVKLHGMPKSIISDRDPIFISKFWKEFFHMSALFTNGRSNETLTYLGQNTGTTQRTMSPQITVFRRAHQKLASKYFGPYPIIRRVGQVAYELKLSTGSRVHPVFHVSLLKKYVGVMPQFSADLPYVDDDGVLIFEPDRIIDVRWLKRGDKLVEQSFVRWKRRPHEDATWEDLEFLVKQFPHLTLEDKGPLRGGGIDTPQRSSRIPKPSNKYAGDKLRSSTVIPANPSFGPWMIVSRKGRGKSTMVVFSGGSRFEVLENEDNEDRGFPSLHDKNGHSTEKDQSAIQFKFIYKKNPKNPTIINSHANVNSPTMQTPSDTTAKYSFLNVNPISEKSTPIFVHAEALSRAQSKNPATSSNLHVPTAIPTSLDPVKHTAIKFLPSHDFHSDPKDISLDPTRPNKELADPNIPINDRDKPLNKDLEMDANDEDDPDDKSFKDKGEKSDLESDDSGTSLEDEDNMESE